MNHSLIDYIGNTPLVEIKKLNPNPKVKIFAKLEYFNPGGSCKDRPALFMIEEGEKSGELTHNKTVIEATSGNTGIGLALICAIKGYKLLLTMSEAVSMERQKILKARGADIVLTPGHLGTDGAIEEVYRMAREYPESYFMTDQYNNEANWKSHYYTTGPEIWEQTNGQVTKLVATMGTGGTLMGLSRRLKEYDPDISIIGVEPYLGHKIQGLKNMKEAYIPEIFEKKRLDAKININDEDAFKMARQLAREEGLLVGMSSGAAMFIAVKEAEKMDSGTIVVLFPDSGERYLSTSLYTFKDKASLQLFNTLSRKKELIKPLMPGKISMYSCGPTAHDKIHLSECRRFVFSDLLCRYLEYRDYSVTHILNITDLDDKTIDGSEKAKVSLAEFTEKHIRLFKKDLNTLKIKPATRYPKVSENIDDMVSLTEKLIQKGYAYENLRSIYFNISRLTDYGALSGVDLNKIKIGATVDLDEYEKENPRDFTLLKRSKLSELKKGIYIKTKWGNVRPSWHIQCAAMSMKYLGDNFDIHTSSRDLVFPHHENEMAIAKALTGKSLANYWIHCDNVLVDGKKEDDKENRITMDDLENMGYEGREIRYWLLSTHYRKPLIFSKQRLLEARRALKKMDSCIYALMEITDGEPCHDIDQILYDIKQEFIEPMDDDLNISAVMASIFKNIKKINKLLSKKQIDFNGAQKLIETFKNIDSVLKIFNFDDKLTDEEISILMQERKKARAEKNWELADSIRNRLKAKGAVIRDDKILN